MLCVSVWLKYNVCRYVFDLFTCLSRRTEAEKEKNNTKNEMNPTQFPLKSSHLLLENTLRSPYDMSIYIQRTKKKSWTRKINFLSVVCRMHNKRHAVFRLSCGIDFLLSSFAPLLRCLLVLWPFVSLFPFPMISLDIFSLNALNIG